MNHCQIESLDQLARLDSFNFHLLNKSPELVQFLDLNRFSFDQIQNQLDQLQSIDTGGFENNDMSSLYVRFQSDLRYRTTRYQGWKDLFAICLDYSGESIDEIRDFLIVDLLAGSGTLSKRAKTLWKRPLPSILGLDVSKKMCEAALVQGESVFWGGYFFNYFKEKSADCVVAAYGIHHIPSAERPAFVSEVKRITKDDGFAIFHDFVEGHPTARWYSEVTHEYRTYGHDYPHFRTEEMRALVLSKFSQCDLELLYDPFFLIGKPDQSPEELIREFFAYLIGLFNLSKILPSGVSFENLFQYSDFQYWSFIESKFKSYFKIEDRLEDVYGFKRNLLDGLGSAGDVLEDIRVPYVSELTVQKYSDRQYCLIAPRIALVGIGYDIRRK